MVTNTTTSSNDTIIDDQATIVSVTLVEGGPKVDEDAVTTIVFRPERACWPEHDHPRRHTIVMDDGSKPPEHVCERIWGVNPR